MEITQSLGNNPNGLSLKLLVGMDASRLLIPIMRQSTCNRCVTHLCFPHYRQHGFGDKLINLQEMNYEL